MKMILMLLIATVSIASLAGAHPHVKLESLLGEGFGSEGVSIQVFSGGCTKNKSFQVVTRVTDDIKRIYFYRVLPDNCRALYRYRTLIYFSYDQLQIVSGERFQIMNPHTAIIKN